MMKEFGCFLGLSFLEEHRDVVAAGDLFGATTRWSLMLLDRSGFTRGIRDGRLLLALASLSPFWCTTGGLCCSSLVLSKALAEYWF